MKKHNKPPETHSYLCKGVISDPRLEYGAVVLITKIHDGMIDGSCNWNNAHVIETRHFKDVPFTLIERPHPVFETFTSIFPDTSVEHLENIKDTEELIIHVLEGAFVAAMGLGEII